MNLDKLNKLIRHKYAEHYIKAVQRHVPNHKNPPEHALVSQLWYFYLARNKIQTESGRLFSPNLKGETVEIPDPHVAQFHFLEQKILVLTTEVAEKILVLGMP